MGAGRGSGREQMTVTFGRVDKNDDDNDDDGDDDDEEEEEEGEEDACDDHGQ